MVLGAHEHHAPATRQLGLCLIALECSANFGLARALAVSFVNMDLGNCHKQVPFRLNCRNRFPLCWAYKINTSKVLQSVLSGMFCFRFTGLGPSYYCHHHGNFCCCYFYFCSFYYFCWLLTTC